MAVVINEMEVVSEPPPSAPSGGAKGGGESSTGSEVQKNHDLERGLKRHRERMERVRAH
jgi:hypothetical protein